LPASWIHHKRSVEKGGLEWVSEPEREREREGERRGAWVGDTERCCVMWERRVSPPTGTTTGERGKRPAVSGAGAHLRAFLLQLSNPRRQALALFLGRLQRQLPLREPGIELENSPRLRLQLSVDALDFLRGGRRLRRYHSQLVRHGNTAVLVATQLVVR
jgi:hypothetical protein